MYLATGRQDQPTMSHKIDSAAPHSPVGGAIPVPARKEPAARATASAGDSVELTDAARLMQRVETLLAAAPVTSRERVDAVRQAIASGAYAIDPQRIAAQVVRLERDLYGSI
jgi:negative regulator of flagellin synthesis FlgM